MTLKKTSLIGGKSNGHPYCSLCRIKFKTWKELKIHRWSVHAYE